MPNPAPGFKTRPDYRVDLVPETRRVRVMFAGTPIADTTAALRVEETGHGPVYYIPEQDVRLDLMRRPPHPLPLQGRSVLLDDRGARRRRRQTRGECGVGVPVPL